jgi:hypothetical protein
VFGPVHAIFAAFVALVGPWMEVTWRAFFNPGDVASTVVMGGGRRRR